MSQYPYEPQQPAYPGQPQDAAPQYPAQPYSQAPQPAYPAQGYPQQPAYYPPPAPVQVNVNQYAGAPVFARKRINHGLHISLTFFTSGLWLFVYIPMLRRARRQVVVYR